MKALQEIIDYLEKKLGRPVTKEELSKICNGVGLITIQEEIDAQKKAS